MGYPILRQTQTPCLRFLRCPPPKCMLRKKWTAGPQFCNGKSSIQVFGYSMNWSISTWFIWRSTMCNRTYSLFWFWGTTTVDIWIFNNQFCWQLLLCEHQGIVCFWLRIWYHHMIFICVWRFSSTLLFLITHDYTLILRCKSSISVHYIIYTHVWVITKEIDMG